MTKLLSESAYIGGVKEVRIKRKNPEYWYFNDHSKPTHIETVSHIPYPAIVSKSMFDAVQQRKIDNRILVDKSVKHTTILSKMIECPECHTFFMGDYRRDRPCSSYRCSKHKGTGKCSNSEEEIINCQEKKKSLQEEVRTLGVIFKNEVRIFGLDKAQQKYDSSVSKIEKQVDEIDAIIESHKKKIREIKSISSTTFTDEDLDRVEKDKKLISEYIHLLVKKVLVFNFNTYTFVRVILNGDNERTFRGIFANKRDNNRIKVFGFKREKDMPFTVRNRETRSDNGDIIEWVESGWEVLEKMLLIEDIELYPIEFKRLDVYGDDFK